MSAAVELEPRAGGARTQRPPPPLLASTHPDAAARSVSAAHQFTVVAVVTSGADAAVALANARRAAECRAVRCVVAGRAQAVTAGRTDAVVAARGVRRTRRLAVQAHVVGVALALTVVTAGTASTACRRRVAHELAVDARVSVRARARGCERVARAVRVTCARRPDRQRPPQPDPTLGDLDPPQQGAADVPPRGRQAHTPRAAPAPHAVVVAGPVAGIEADAGAGPAPVRANPPPPLDIGGVEPDRPPAAPTRPEPAVGSVHRDVPLDDQQVASGDHHSGPSRSPLAERVPLARSTPGADEPGRVQVSVRLIRAAPHAARPLPPVVRVRAAGDGQPQIRFDRHPECAAPASTRLTRMPPAAPIDGRGRLQPHPASVHREGAGDVEHRVARHLEVGDDRQRHAAVDDAGSTRRRHPQDGASEQGDRPEREPARPATRPVPRPAPRLAPAMPADVKDEVGADEEGVDPVHAPTHLEGALQVGDRGEFHRRARRHAHVRVDVRTTLVGTDDGLGAGAYLKSAESVTRQPLDPQRTLAAAAITSANGLGIAGQWWACARVRVRVCVCVSEGVSFHSFHFF